MMDRLPSLAALRAFELVARTGSLSDAADALNVTHAAISQHIRTLEREFAQPLTRREGRGTALTPAGQRLATALAEGFGAISRGVEETRRAVQAGPLRISLTPSFAEHWLMPRMGRFWTAHPGVELALVPSTGLVDLRRDGFDLAIRYGFGTWPGVKAEYLTSAEYVIVGAPQLATGPIDLATLKGQRWLINDSDPEQIRWAQDLGIDPAEVDATRFPTFGMMYAAVRSGLGIAMLSHAVAERDLEEGQLIRLYDGAQAKRGYFLLTQPGQVTTRLTPFLRWIRQEARAGAAPAGSTGSGVTGSG